MVAAEIMPRSATTQTRPMEKRRCKRSTTGKQRRHVGGIARPHLGANRPAVAVDDEAEDHLLQIGPIVLGIAVLAQRLAALAVEGEAGGVHEHGGEVGEQIAAAVEQPLLDQVLDAARRERPVRLLLQFLAEPGHGAIEVMQIEPFGAGDVVILDPRRTVAVRSRNEQPMQRGDEHGALDRKLERALLQQVGQDGVNRRAAPRSCRTAAARRSAWPRPTARPRRPRRAR